MTPRPLRSVLFLPASNPRAVDKARGLPCDAVVLDLEDAVAPAAKAEARAAAAAALRQGGYGDRLVAVRVNGLDSPWVEEDLAAVAAAGAEAVVVPKLGGAAELNAWNQRLASAPGAVRLWAMIETCAGVLNLAQIAAAAAETRLAALLFGPNDLSRDMGRRAGRDRTPLHPALAWTVTAARAAGLTPLDGVFNDLEATEAFEAECAEGRAFGFDGKCLIHPSQIEPANRLFSPAPEELAWARAVVAAFADPAAAGQGALRVDGAMVERLHLDQARRLLAAAGRA